MDLNFRRKVYRNSTGYRGLTIPPMVSEAWGSQTATVIMTLKDDGTLVIRPAHMVK
jgi:hypothetical protein